MVGITCKLTVLFKEPFWIGLYERTEDGCYTVCKITFGSEPKDYEVYEFMLKNWNGLRFAPAIETVISESKRVNPKRLQRLITKQINDTAIGTKAQQALKLQQEQGKLTRKSYSRQQKRKEKHKGH